MYVSPPSYTPSRYSAVSVPIRIRSLHNRSLSLFCFLQYCFILLSSLSKACFFGRFYLPQTIIDIIIAYRIRFNFKEKSTPFVKNAQIKTVFIVKKHNSQKKVEFSHTKNVSLFGFEHLQSEKA